MLKEVVEEMGKRYSAVGPMLTITFKKEGINALKLLYNLKYIGVVRFNKDIVVHALVGSGDWEEKDSNRVVEAFFPLSAIFKNETFLTVIAKDIESIKLSTHHEINGLMTGRKKIQEDLAEKIIHDCYNNPDWKEFMELGFTLYGELETINGLPQITFTLKDFENTKVATIVLDGWSGQIIIDGIHQNIAYRYPEEFHWIVKDLANKHLEKITAPSKELTTDEAREVLKNWLEAQGYEREKISTFSAWFKGDNINFEVKSPYGLFKVNKVTGEVEDNYGYFSEEKADDHDQTACHCRFCSGVAIGKSTKV